MNKKGYLLIDSLLFFFIVLIIVSYISILMNTITKIEPQYENKDHVYEEAYK